MSSNDALISQSSSPPNHPAHLSEFYSFVNSGSQSPHGGSNDGLGYGHSRNNSDVSVARSAGGAGAGVRSGSVSGVAVLPRNSRGTGGTDTGGPGPGTPWSSIGNIFRKPSIASFQTTDSTITSSFANNLTSNHPDLPALITSNEITNSINSYQNLLDSAAKYREAILTVSKASADFGEALELCSRCKGAGNASDGLQSAGGLHYLVSNHQQILAKSISSTFEVPVKRQLDAFKQITKENEQKFRLQLKERTRNLKRRELESQKMAHRRVRNLVEYRNSLLELTSLVDEIDRLKYAYFQSTYNIAESSSNEILQYAASVVRAEVEIYEGIARKGWSGGGLEDLISTCPDPFNVEEEVGVGASEVNEESGSKFSGIYGLIAGSGANADKPKIKRSSTSSAVHKNKQIFSILPSNSILPKPKGEGESGGGDEEEGRERDIDSESDNENDNDINTSTNANHPSYNTTADDSFFIENDSTVHKSLSDRMLSSQNWKSQEGFPKDDILIGIGSSTADIAGTTIGSRDEFIPITSTPKQSIYDENDENDLDERIKSPHKHMEDEYQF